MYRNFLKRAIDFLLALIFLLLLFPLLLLLAFVGAIKMKGNPFFFQERPGKGGKIFRLVKLRSMSEERDAKGKLLPDEKRLTAYGKFLRRTSLDELPELFNILKGDMAIVGPRPLLVKYLPLYNDRQKRRHEVRPGLTGLAQVKGRNAISWDERFSLDVAYVEKLNFFLDLQIVLLTVVKVIKKEGISSSSSETMEEFKGSDVT